MRVLTRSGIGGALLPDDLQSDFADESPLEGTHSPIAPTQDALPVRTSGYRGMASRIFFWAFGLLASASEWVFGLASMLTALAILAAFPVLQFISLGYLLEATGSVIRTGKLGSGFIGIRTAARLGGVVIASWLLLLPVRYLGDVAFTAGIIDPNGPRANRLRNLVLILTCLIGFHICMAIARGGRFRHFLWPLNFLLVFREIRKGNAYSRTRDATWDLLISMRLPYLFWLGLRGFIGALFWLVLPVTLLALGHAPIAISPLFGFAGALWLAITVVYLPIMQARFAAENRFWALFEWREARFVYGRAPWCISLALIVALLSAIPLYLLKIEAVPAEAIWLPSLVFMAFMFPARIIMGWAISQTRTRIEPRHWFFRWTGRLPIVPATLFYVLFVFLSQYFGWDGILGMYEQHAFLLPVPFFGK